MDELLWAKDLSTHRGTFFLGPLNIQVPKGSIVGLVGENGAGKTTLIQSLLGLCWSRGETVILPDTPAGQDYRQDLGVVFGDPGLPANIYPYQIDEIMYAAYDNWDGEKFRHLLSKFNLPETGKYADLSQGGKKKLELAIALSHDPKLLILDEPGAGLDPVARDQLNDILFDFTRDEEHGVLVSSHILSDLERICDYIAFLHGGMLVFFEEKDRLLERYGIYRCSAQERMALPKAAVMGYRHGSYGDEVLINKAVRPDLETGITTVEDIMVLMVKGVRE